MMIILELISLSFALLLSLFALSLSISFLFGPPFAITPKKLVWEMLRLAKINSNDIVIDLGSGDGRILIESAKICKKARGIEINPFLVLITKLNARAANVSRKVSVHLQNYKNAKINDGTVIFLYNIRSSLPEVEKKLKNDLKLGTRIVSYKFPLRSLKLVSKTESGLYLYKIDH